MPYPNTSPSNLADLYLNEHQTQPRGVSAWWRAISIALLILLGLGIASAMSMYEQFKAQMEHMQTQLHSVPQIKTLAVLTDDKNTPPPCSSRKTRRTPPCNCNA
jgi:hypothetical protein